MQEDKKQPLDMSQLDTRAPANEGANIELENPFTGEPLEDDDGKPYYIEIFGGDSDKVQEQLRRIADRRLERIQKKRTIETDSTVGRKDDINTLALATKSWYIMPVDGETLECNEHTAKRLYSDKRFPWIFEQLEKAIGDRKRFFKKNSAT